jgi:hypothetical protein
MSLKVAMVSILFLRQFKGGNDYGCVFFAHCVRGAV